MHWMTALIVKASESLDIEPKVLSDLYLLDIDPMVSTMRLVRLYQTCVKMGV